VIVVEGGIPVVESVFPVFQPESPEAQAIYDLFIVVLLISAGIFVVVAGLILVAIVRGRANGTLPEQDFGSHKREISWMVGPVIIVLWIAAISAKLILTMNAYPKVHPSRDATADAELTVVGHQWWWEIRYNGSGLVGANEVHIPVGKRIRVQLQSADVIHCFWVPQLARKMDVIPGRDNYIWLEASKPGVYQGRCAEYCGNQHAWMNFKVYAHEPDEFAQWQAASEAVPANPTESEAAAGARIFFAQTCVNCHTIDGTAAVASIGPNLTHISRRQEIGGGVLENSPENLGRWLTNPQEFKPGCKMPNFNLTNQEVRQLVSYLESLE
jgi:cytochrome c oxidase subunit 2